MQIVMLPVQGMMLLAVRREKEEIRALLRKA